MATDFKSIPIIDVSPLLAKCDDPKMAEDPDACEVVRQLDRACREAGFFYAKGHGIPDSMLTEVRKVTHAFFDLPYEEKLKIKMSAATGFRGYQRIGENVTKGTPDMHEAIDALHRHAFYNLSRKIMRGIALALGGTPDEFEGERAGDPFWVMRLIGYPGVTNANRQEDMAENDIGCGAHTDYGLLTLVNQDDDMPALQVKNHSGEWIWAVPIPGTFVCNIGDMLNILSNGLYESTLHRVINMSPKYRASVAYFYEPNFEAALEPLGICTKRTGGSPRFGKAVYGEHLVRKVQTNFAM